MIREMQAQMKMAKMEEEVAPKKKKAPPVIEIEEERKTPVKRIEIGAMDNDAALSSIENEVSGARHGDKKPEETMSFPKENLLST